MGLPWLSRICGRLAILPAWKCSCRLNRIFLCSEVISEKKGIKKDFIWEFFGIKFEIELSWFKKICGHSVKIQTASSYFFCHRIHLRMPVELIAFNLLRLKDTGSSVGNWYLSRSQSSLRFPSIVTWVIWFWRSITNLKSCIYWRLPSFWVRNNWVLCYSPQQD